jgi:hypothetical protein
MVVYALGNDAVEGVQIHIVAAPGDFLAVASEADAGGVHDGTVRRVLAGNPFRVHQREGAGLYGEFHFRMVDATRGVAEVDFKLYGLRRCARGSDP